MRFVLAIVAFVLAAAMIGAGIAQRTIWAPAAGISAQTLVKGGTPYTVIDGSVLNSHPGQQTLTINGSKNPKNDFVAYGRTADVLAWIGDEKYEKIGYSQASNALSATVVDPRKAKGGSTSTPTPSATATPAPTPTPAPTSTAAAGATTGPSPVGSDLWLEQFVGTDAAVTRMNVPDTISVIIANNGKTAAPPSVTLAWPLDTSTPWSGPLIAGGGILLIVGLLLYIFALRHLRKSRGPRRSGPKPPKLPRGRGDASAGSLETPKGRRSIGRASIAVPAVLITSLALSGCTSQFWPSLGGAPTPTPTTSAIATDLPGQGGKQNPPPVVTGPQLDDIVTRISTVATEADSKLDQSLIATRFTGPALAERTANYQVRSKDSSLAALPAIPSGPVVVSLPQATTSWPRVVSAVVQDKKDAKAAPIDLVLVQDTPRSNYLVNYAIPLEAEAKVPPLAPASVGTAVLPPDSKLLLLEPDKIADAYADILMNGSNSKSYSLFDTASDKLLPQYGADAKAKQIADFSKTASLSFTDEAGPGDPIAMATNDSGAIVSTNVQETSTTKVLQAGATVNATGGYVNALTGKSSSGTGFVVTYDYQLLFYVPPADSKDKIRLLGFTSNIISAQESS